MSETYRYSVDIAPADKGLDPARYRLVLVASRVDEGEMSKADLAAVKGALAAEIAAKRPTSKLQVAAPPAVARKAKGLASKTTNSARTKRAAAHTKRAAAPVKDRNARSAGRR